MIRLYQASDRIEAQLLKDFLGDQGVEAVVLGDYLSGAAGELPAMQFPVIWLVHDDDLERARELIGRFRGGVSDAGPPWRCPVCGEESEGHFALCWRCGSARPRE